MRRLVESWIKAERQQHGNDLAAAIKRMNEKRKMKLTHSRVGEWRKGKHEPSAIVTSQMLYRALRWMLKDAGIAVSASQYDALVKRLWVTGEKDGQPFVELL